MANESKVVVSIPNGLLKEIDREARERGVSRGDFFLKAARHELDRRDLAQVDVAIKRGQVALAKVGCFDSADLLRADRAKRDAHDRGR
jgi:metal-responsive CopG/Arc/MetJ family transcriptional regulator